MAQHTIDEAIQLLEQAPLQRLVGPRTRTWYHGDPAKPDRVCPIIYLAQQWLPEAAFSNFTMLDIADDALLLIGLDRHYRYNLTDLYDHSPSKQAGVQRLVKYLRKIASSHASQTVV